MHFGVALILTIVVGGSASAQQLQPGMQALNDLMLANQRWGGCLLGKANVGGNRFDLGDIAIDAAVQGCWPLMGAMLGAGSPASRAHMDADARAHPQTLREPAVQAMFNAYRAQHFKHAGGQPADSTARSK